MENYSWTGLPSITEGVWDHLDREKTKKQQNSKKPGELILTSRSSIHHVSVFVCLFHGRADRDLKYQEDLGKQVCKYASNFFISVLEEAK